MDNDQQHQWQYVPGMAPMVPPWWFGQQQQHQPSREATVPPRVQVAMEFHRRITAKTATIPMPTFRNEGTGNLYEVQPVEGQKLTQAEQATLDDACDVLGKYFNGRLEGCPWDMPVDEVQYSSLRQISISCPKCGSNPRLMRECDMCCGAGRVGICRFEESRKAPLDESEQRKQDDERAM